MTVKHPTSVFEKLEFRGKWWLPESAEHRISGVLSGNDAEGFRLRTDGSLCPENDTKSQIEELTSFFTGGPMESHQFIHGITQYGPVTLFDSFQVANQPNSHGLKDLAYYSNLVLNGAHFERADQLQFYSVRAKFSVLCDWLDARVFTPNFENGIRRSQVQFSFPSKQQIFDGDDFSIELDFSISGPGLSVGQNNVLVEWEPQFVVSSKCAELPLRERANAWNYYSIIGALNHFLSVATFGPSYPFDVVAYSQQFEPNATAEKKKYDTPIAVYREHQPESSKYQQGQVLCPWKMLSENPGRFFKNWFAAYRSLQAPIGLLVDSLNRRNSYSPERFFNLVMALEGIHRFKHPGTSQPSAAHTNKINAILESVPPAQRTWLADRLAYSHEPSLMRRLKDLIKPFQRTFYWLIGAEGSIKSQKDKCGKVLSAIKDSRNCLAHGLPEVGVNPGQRYLHFTVLAELLMAMWLMREIAFTDQQIDEQISKNFYVRQHQKRLAEFCREKL